jgi:hypothetical protein
MHAMKGAIHYFVGDVMKDEPKNLQSGELYAAGFEPLSLNQIEQASERGFSLWKSEISTAREAEVKQNWIGDKLWRLYIPVMEGTPGSRSQRLIASLQEMGLAASVPISLERNDENLQFLRHCVDPNAMVAEPYLEVLVSGGSAVVLHFLGDDIMQELADLSKQIRH